MKISLISQAAILWRLTDKNLKVPQKHYKLDHDMKVCFEPTYAPGAYVNFDKPVLTISAAESLAPEGSSELMPERACSVRRVECQT